MGSESITNVGEIDSTLTPYSRVYPESLSTELGLA